MEYFPLDSRLPQRSIELVNERSDLWPVRHNEQEASGLFGPSFVKNLSIRFTATTLTMASLTSFASQYKL